MKFYLKKIMSTMLAAACVISSFSPTRTFAQEKAEVQAEQKNSYKKSELLMENGKPQMVKTEVEVEEGRKVNVVKLYFKKEIMDGGKTVDQKRDYLDYVAIAVQYDHPRSLHQKSTEYLEKKDEKSLSKAGEFSIGEDEKGYFIALVDQFDFKKQDAPKKLTQMMEVFIADRENNRYESIRMKIMVTGTLRFHSYLEHSFYTPKGNFKPKLKVEFKKNNEWLSSAFVAENGKVEAPQDSTVEYWYVEGDEKKTAFDFNKSITSDLTLVAQMKEGTKNYTVEFISLNDDKLAESVSVPEGMTVSKPKDVPNVVEWRLKGEDREFKFDTPVDNHLKLIGIREYTAVFKYYAHQKEVKVREPGTKLTQEVHEELRRVPEVDYWQEEGKKDVKYKDLSALSVNRDMVLVAVTKKDKPESDSKPSPSPSPQPDNGGSGNLAPILPSPDGSSTSVTNSSDVGAVKEEVKPQEEVKKTEEAVVAEEETPLGEAEASKMLMSFGKLKMKDLKFRGYKKFVMMFEKARSFMKKGEMLKNTGKLYKELQSHRKKYVKKNINVKRILPIRKEEKSKRTLLKLVKKMQNYAMNDVDTKTFLKGFKAYRSAIEALNNKNIPEKKLKEITKRLGKEKKNMDLAMKMAR